MFRIHLILALLTSFAFCQDQVSIARSAAGCGPKTVEFNVDEDKTHPITEPDSGKSVVYIFADAQRGPMVTYMSSAVVRVGLDGAWVGASRRNSYFSFTIEPGEHRLCSDMQIGSAKVHPIGWATTFNAEAGKSYYFRIKFEERYDRPPYLELERIDGAAGMFLISSSSHAISNPKK